MNYFNVASGLPSSFDRLVVARKYVKSLLHGARGLNTTLGKQLARLWVSIFQVNETLTFPEIFTWFYSGGVGCLQVTVLYAYRWFRNAFNLLTVWKFPVLNQSFNFIQSTVAQVYFNK